MNTNFNRSRFHDVIVLDTCAGGVGGPIVQSSLSVSGSASSILLMYGCQ